MVPYTNGCLFFRSAFWCKHLNYRNRLLVASFCYCNGVNFQLLKDFLIARSQIQPRQIYEIEKLYDYWDDNDEARARYYAYDVTVKEFTYLNGKIKNRHD